MTPESNGQNPAERKWGSVRTRLILWNVATLAIILAILGASAVYALRAQMLNSVDEELRNRGRSFSSMPGFSRQRPMRSTYDPATLPPTRTTPESDPGIRSRDLTWPRLLDLEGRDHGVFRGLGTWDWNAFLAARRGEETFSTAYTYGVPVRIYTMPVYREGRVDAVWQIPFVLTETERAVAVVERILMTLIPLALVLTAAGGAVVTGRGLRPVREITRAAERIEASDLSHRLPAEGNDEFSHLARTFNGMLERLETAFARQKALLERQRQFTGDASHELKTPLTVVKVNAAQLQAGGFSEEDRIEAARDIEHASDRMSRLVQDLLLLSRSDDGQLRQKVGEVPVAQLLSCAARQVSIDGCPPVVVDPVDPALTVEGDEAELSRVFANLLENALRHTPAEGEVRIATRVRDQAVEITVSDTGCGIAPEHLPHLGERFYRVDSARSRADGGAGLGLSICKSILSAHGGSLTIESEVGKGTAVTVHLPVLEDAPGA